jgi:polyphosphate glucokinase
MDESQPAPPETPLRILSVDIGGSGLKAAVLDAEGNMITERERVKTPSPCTTGALMEALAKLVEPLKVVEFNRISIGFPGVVRRGVVLTAPKIGTQELQGFPLAQEVEQALGHPTRLINDAEMQGLAVVRGHGVEVVLTFGTGMGSAIFHDGQLGPHLELSVHPFRKGETYNDQLGDDAFKRVGAVKWNRRVRRAVKALRALTTFDRLYLGGGNAREIVIPLEDDTEIIDNANGIRGGAWLWRQNISPP